MATGNPPGRTRGQEPETHALRRLQVALHDAELAMSHRTGLHPTAIHALSYLLSTDETVGPKELAIRLGISPATATELVDRLTAGGHVERHRDLADRRRLRLEATPEATALIHQHGARLVERLDAIARDASAEERAATQRYFARVVEAFGEWSEESPES